MSDCADNVLPTPAGIGIPENINVGMMPYIGNASVEALRSCCEPNEVHRVGENWCTMWCELPDEFMEQAGEQGSGAPLSSVLSQCIRNANPNGTATIVMGQRASGAAGKMSPFSIRGAGVVLLGMLAAGQVLG